MKFSRPASDPLNADSDEPLLRQVFLRARESLVASRSPFRRVDLHPPVLTAAGEVRPSLVFWINRDSCMAGGILFIAEEEAAVLDGAERCATALGLRHFVVWSSRDVVLWQTGEGSRTRKPLGATERDAAPAAVFARLDQILEELKLAAVLGAVPPAQMCSAYLANLCRVTLQDLQTLLADELQATRGESPASRRMPVGSRALAKATLALLRLLALIHHDRLPSTVHPERLEAAMAAVAGGLPELAGMFAPAAGEPSLPQAAAVRLHHLARRLEQLPQRYNRDWIGPGLDLLMENLAPALGGYPFSEPARSSGGTVLLVAPDRVFSGGGSLLEVGPPPLLAFTALHRSLTGGAPAAAQAAEPWLLRAGPTPETVIGTLTDDGATLADELPELLAGLRRVWPNRRFRLPRRTPRWLYRMICLLGQVGDHARVDLTVPRLWFGEDFAPPALALLRQHFAIERFCLAADGSLRMLLDRSDDPPAEACFAMADRQRCLPQAQVRDGHRSLLTLALRAGDEVFSLLTQGALALPGPDRPPWPTEAELLLYSRSSWGRYFWGLLASGRLLPPRRSLVRQLTVRGVPLPAQGFWERWRELSADSPSCSPAAFEAQLGDWLGPCPAFSNGRPRRPIRLLPAASDADAFAGLREDVDRKVFVDGIPRFPEHYLLDCFRPDLEDYRFHGPLAVCGSFFDRFLLEDREGRVLEAVGEETALALQLASYDHAEAVRLPLDRQLTAAIVGRYLGDLKSLRQRLLRETRSRIADDRHADRLVADLWREHCLPPWELLAG